MRFAIILSSLALLFACSKSDTDSKQPEKKEVAEPAAEPVAKPMPEPKTLKPAGGALQAAPDFTLKDLDGNDVSLSQFKGKTVVLEWFNPGCPFVKYAHGEGPLADMAARYAKNDVVWLAINSGAPGKQGHGAELNQSAAKKWGMSHPILTDEDGMVGKLYGAKTTPHMYIVDPEGKLAYRGALDNAPLGQADGDPVNYVDAVLGALANGQKPTVADQQSYGCSVKYAK